MSMIGIRNAAGLKHNHIWKAICKVGLNLLHNFFDNFGQLSFVLRPVQADLHTMPAHAVSWNASLVKGFHMLAFWCMLLCQMLNIHDQGQCTESQAGLTDSP